VNFVHLAWDNIDKYGEYVLLNFESQEYTNTDMERLSNRLGHGLLKMGLQKDDRIIVFLPNIPEILVSYLAILRAGAIVVPVNPALSPHELSYIISHSEATMVITSGDLAGTVHSARELSKVKPLVIIAGRDPYPDSIPFVDCYADNDTFLMVDRPDDTTAAIIYTSGTTGQPKGVMLSHFNLYMEGHSDAQSCGICDANGTPLLDQVHQLCVLPLPHVYGLSTMALALLARGTIFLMRDFDIEQILKCIQEQEITVFAGSPNMYACLAIFPDAEKYNTSSVARWISGAAALSLEIRQAFEKRYKATILEGYGLTETVSGFSMQRHDRLVKPGSVGPVIPSAEVRVVDDEGRPLPPGHMGELTIKGPIVMKGYYQNEQETARVIKDGWFFTGDIGYMDEDGDIFIVDRKKDLIIRGGFNIYPSEVEEVLCSHLDISDAGVVGIPDKDYGEQVCAFVVLKEGAQTSKTDIQSFCRESLAKYKVPHYIEFCDRLPKNELGKTLRRELKVNLDSLAAVGEIPI